ncbi:hypothetical protein RhiLY_09119 [Ceratobasidium sp. AG-Ba]|nr:hypothetical protein RhiLY_09119 [Ceratobasidium sp. AG-Ba]
MDTFTPFTISLVVKVSLDRSVTSLDDGSQTASKLPKEMILKVFDRRFAYSLRAFHKAPPATYETEEAYRQYMAAAPNQDFLVLEQHMAAAVGPFHRDPKEAPGYLLEHSVTLRATYYFEDECAEYKRLAHLQGKDVPIFYGTVEFASGLSAPELDPPIQGVLIEAVPGVTLDKLDPGSVDVDRIIRGALRIVRALPELDIVNEDPRLGNFIAKPDGTVVMIDLAQSRIRDEAEDDEEWFETRRGADEENRIEFEAEKLYGRLWVLDMQFSKEEAGEIRAIAGPWTKRATAQG